MEYQILREDGKNILWLNGQFIGSVSDDVAERIHQSAQHGVQRTAEPSCEKCGWDEGLHSPYCSNHPDNRRR